MNEPLLKLKNLRVAFPANGGEIEAVKSSSFEIVRGEVLALVGESGSGKTLTALSLMGLLPPNAKVSGTIQFEGRPLRDQGDFRKLRGSRMAMIFQEPMTALNPLHTIERQIGEMIVIHQPLMKKSARQARILELLDKVGLGYLSDRLDAYPHQLSGGERQRVMIAVAIANNPALLIADEPTAAVDVTIQKQILELLQKLQKENSMSILLITHDLTLVRRIASRVAIMHQGLIVESGKTSEIFANPKQAYTQKLLASEPKGAPTPCPIGSPLLLKAEGLSVRFPLRRGFLQATTYKTAVENVSLKLCEGETLGIVGESGSGKSSLAYALLRLVKSEGSILYHDRTGERISLRTLSAAAIRPLRKDLQIVFQDPFSSLNPRMTIEDIVAEGLRVQASFAGHEASEFRKEIPDRVEEILTEVGLSPEIKNRYPHEFSGGQRQRVAIARAMVLRPRLIVLDEPTSALDLTIQAQILELLAELQRKYKTAYLFISHDLRVVRALSHRIMVLKEGRIIETGTNAEIFNTPREPYTKALMEASILSPAP